MRRLYTIALWPLRLIAGLALLAVYAAIYETITRPTLRKMGGF